MISLKDLEFLTSLARHGHFARAAEDCGVSQPAFSMRIRKLEERLNAPIVKRGNRFQGFTPEGEALMRHARKIMDGMKLLEEEFRSAGGEVTGQLSLGVIPTAVGFAAEAVGQLRAAHPGITVRLQTASSLTIQQGLEKRVFDAGITYGEGVLPELMRVESLYHERYVLVAPKALAPRREGHATWAEAAELPLSLLEPSMQNRRILDLVFREAGVIPSVVAETGEFTSSILMAGQGVAATVIPEGLLHSLGEMADTIALPLTDPALEKDVSLVTPHSMPSLSTVDALRNVLDLST